MVRLFSPVSRNLEFEIPIWRRGLYGLLTTLVVCGALAAAGELWSRAHLGPRFVAGLLPTGRPVHAIAMHDPDCGWVNKPDVKTRVEAPLFHYVVSHNSLGQRGRERSYAKAPGTKRVLLLGDSLAWGWGVDDGLEFAALAERELGPSVEIINLGVPGYSTDQQWLRFEREVALWDPDLVLLSFLLNDVPGNSTENQWTIAQRKPVFQRDPAGGWSLVGHPVPVPEGHAPSADWTTGAARAMPLRQSIYARSALAQILFPPDAEARVAQTWAAQALERLAFPRSQAELNAEQRMVLEGITQSVRALSDELVAADSVTHYLLGRLAQGCHERGLPLVAFSIAHDHDQYLHTLGLPLPTGIERHLETGAAPFETHLTRRLREAGQMLGFEVFSVDQAMLEEVLSGRRLNVGDGHLNELGNRVVARRLVEELAARFDSGPSPQ